MLEDLKTVSSTEKDIQNFSHMVGGVLILIGVFSFLFGGERFMYLFVGGGVLLLLGVFSPWILRPFQRAWMILAIVMGWIVTRFILGMFFYTVLTPIAFIAYLVGKRFLDFGEESVSSYWIPRPAEQKSKESYTQQF